MLKEASMRGFIRSLLLAASVWSAGVGIAQAVELQWWSHWAIEDNKKAVLFEAKRRFEQRNPGHTVTITFYEKKNMFTALRAAFTAPASPTSSTTTSTRPNSCRPGGWPTSPPPSARR